jgi:hypothetical protein
MISNIELFDQQVPLKFQRAVLQSILSKYQEASRYCYKNFNHNQAKDLSGVYRRTLIEEEWNGMAQLFPALRVEPKYYDHNTGTYNELTYGLVKLTQSCVTGPNEVPRFAEYRSTLAQNGQLKLQFEAEQSNPTETNNRFLYSILTHGVDLESKNRSLPAFARIQFPNAQCTAYLDRGIDLFQRFSDVLAAYLPKQTSEVLPTEKQNKKKREA